MNTTLLTVCGYEREEFEEYWTDVGGPESGPRIVGHGAGTAWRLDNHKIIVEEGRVVFTGFQQPKPPGRFEMKASNQSTVWFQMDNWAEGDDKWVAALWQWLGKNANDHELPKVIRIRDVHHKTIATYRREE